MIPSTTRCTTLQVEMILSGLFVSYRIKYWTVPHDGSASGGSHCNKIWSAAKLAWVLVTTGSGLVENCTVWVFAKDIPSMKKACMFSRKMSHKRWCWRYLLSTTANGFKGGNSKSSTFGQLGKRIASFAVQMPQFEWIICVLSNRTESTTTTT